MWRALSRAFSFPVAHSVGGPYHRLWLALLALILLGSTKPAHLNASTRAQTTDLSTLYVLTFAGPVTPVLESYLNQAIREAEATGAGAVILQLDTPGGSIEVTHSIIQSMLASPVPLVVYVAPAGARAGSAGTFVTLAAHVAAMAPNTSIGAASPVESGGGDIEPTLAAKVTNILSADIENLARHRGEAATEWAVAAVQDAAAATAQQALDLGVIDLIANDIDHLVEQLEGRTVELPSGPSVLHVSSAAVVAKEMTPVQRALNLLVDPNLAAILLSLGVLGLIVEIRTPGLNFAGILGVICLILAFYALGQLDANLTGLIFMIVAIGLFVAEAFTPSFGLLAAGGIIAFLLGGALLFDTPGISTPWPTLILLAILMGGLTILVSYLALRAQRSPALTGTEGLIGAVGITKEPFHSGETGAVFVQGEWWNARIAEGEVAANTQVRVLARERMTLLVAPLNGQSSAAAGEPQASAT
jgi:membrane-bound serine protease (ClpP class)